jgi:hypothetical protein
MERMIMLRSIEDLHNEFEGFEVEHDFPSTGRQKVPLNARDQSGRGASGHDPVEFQGYNG